MIAHPRIYFHILRKQKQQIPPLQVLNLKKHSELIHFPTFQLRMLNVSQERILIALDWICLKKARLVLKILYEKKLRVRIFPIIPRYVYGKYTRFGYIMLNECFAKLIPECQNPNFIRVIRIELRSESNAPVILFQKKFY